MKNWGKILVYSLITLFFVGCHRFGTSSLQGTESPEPVKISTDKVILLEMNPSKEDILSAFRFWVNKQAWLYEDFEYVDEQKTVEIRYKELDENGYQGYLGYLYFPFEQKGSIHYKQISFFFGEDGFESEPSSEEETEEIGDELIYLGKEIFYFAKDDVTKPEFPASSSSKNNFIEKAKQNIINSIHSLEFEESKDKIGEYKVYIENFTNQDITAQVVIIKDDEKVWGGEIYNQIQLDDGSISKDVGLFKGFYKEALDWSNKRIRKAYEKSMQLSICNFIVTVS